MSKLQKNYIRSKKVDTNLLKIDFQKIIEDYWKKVLQNVLLNSMMKF